MDVFALPFATAAADSFVRVWGISLQDISQAFDLNFKPIKVFGGMGKGLPLANPAQAGLLVQGSVKQAFGNWIGTAMTLDLIVTAQLTDSASTDETPRNLSLNWKAKTPLKDAISTTLKSAFPSYTSEINISDKLVLEHDEQGYYASMPQFAALIKTMSKDVVGGSYPGVDILLSQTTFKVYDGTTQKTPREIKFTDLIGQVTWIEPLTVQATCVMRADVSVGDFIKLPPGQVTVSQAALSSLSQMRQGSVFKGSFMVTKVRHVGNYKQPDAQAWVTVLDCAAVPGEADLPAPTTAPIPPTGFTGFNPLS